MKRWRRGFGRAFAALVWIGLALLAAALLAPWLSGWEALPPRTRIWLGIIENFYPALALASLVLTLCALTLRGRSAAVLAFGAALFAIMPVLASTHAKPVLAPDTRKLKVVTFNVWVRNADAAALVGYLRVEQPDIVFLQEVTEPDKQALAALTDLYPTQVTCHTGIIHCETMLLARFPARSQQAGPIAGGMPSTAIAELDLGDHRRLTAIAVHLAQPFPMHGHDAQREQAVHFAQALDAYPGALLIGGDFNGSGWARNPNEVRSLARLSGEPGLHPSWPALPYRGISVPEWLRLPIDHLFARGGPVIASAGVGPKLGSDHLPMLAVVALPSDGN